MGGVLANTIGIGAMLQNGVEDLVENNNNDTNISYLNLEGELTSQTTFKQPPPAWSEFRKKAVCKNNTLPVKPISNNGLKVNDCRSISPEEFNSV